MQIYKTTNLINGKIYIGQDSNNNPNYYGSGININRSILKYGKENFKKEILEEGIKKQKELNFLEEFWIEFFNSTNNKIGYNISKVALGLHKGFKHTKERNLKISIKAKNRKYLKKRNLKISIKLKNRIYSKETIQKMSKPKHTEEFKRKIGFLHKNNKYLLGFKYSEESKQKMSNSHIGKTFTKSHCQKISEGKLIYSKQQIEEVIKLLNNTNLIHKEIGNRVKIKVGTIDEIKQNRSYYNKYYNLYYDKNFNHPRNLKYSKQQIEQVINLLKNSNLMQKEIKNQLNINIDVISQIKLNKSCYNKIYNLYF